MLTYNAIMEEAKNRDMPVGKIRGVVREYLQTLILKYLYNSKWQDKFFFLGGTSLRLLYGLKRFSEDLDFNVRGITQREFENAARFISNELGREGISCILKFSHRHPLFISEFAFRDIQGRYGIVDKRGEIIIKLEANAPEYNLETESSLVNGFGELFLVNAMSKGSIFADKIDTLRNKKNFARGKIFVPNQKLIVSDSGKKRGRHVYDMIFMLSKNFPINRDLLKVNGITEEPREAILSIINNIPDNQLKKLSEEVAPFLFDEAESKLIKNAKIVVKNLLDGYKNEMWEEIRGRR